MSERVLFVSHDASRSGAPIVLLHLLRWLRQTAGLDFDVLLLRGGPLETEFREVARRCYLDWYPERAQNTVARNLLRVMRKLGLLEFFRLKQIARQHRRHPYRLLYANTCATTPAIVPLKRVLQAPVLMHIHELEFAIHCCAGVDAFRKVIPHVDQFVAVSQMVAQNLRDNWHIPARKIARIPAFIQDEGSCRRRGTGDAVRRRLGIPKDAFVVGGCGPVEWHKGTDLFVLVAKEVIDSKPPRPVHFLWLGANENAPTFLQVQMDLKKLGLLENVHFLGCQPNPMDYFDAFDVLLLTSREDSFPLVCLENAVLGNPVLCFDRAVGSTEYVDDTCGHVSPYMDTSDMAQTVLRLCHDSETCYAFAQRIRQKVQKYTVANCGQSILQVIEALVGTAASATGPSPAGRPSTLSADLVTSPGTNDG